MLPETFGEYLLTFDVEWSSGSYRYRLAHRVLGLVVVGVSSQH